MTSLTSNYSLRALSILASALLITDAAAAAPVVSNVRASQRTDGTGLVDVYYDLSGASGSV